MTPVLAALVLALPLIAPPLDVRKVAWPDGTPREEYEVELDARGREIKSGPYRAWHANGELAVEGAFAQDAETGRWKFHREDGSLEAEGSFARGERSGSWTTYHANGKRASRGRYDEGRRAGEWTFWSEDGRTDPERSGIYEHVTLDAGGGQVLEGELLDGERHGEWTSRWPDGAPQASGAYERGRASGAWRFRHRDGGCSRLLSARYEDGVRIGPLELTDEECAPLAPPGEPRGEVEAGPLGWPADVPAVERVLDDWLRLSPEELTARAAKRQYPPILSEGLRAVPVALRRMHALDPELAEDRRRMAWIQARVLAPLLGGRVLSDLPPTGPASAEEARELVRDWSSAWAATKHDLWFWRIELGLDWPPPESGKLELLAPPLPLAPAARDAGSVPAVYARRYEPRGGRTEAALQAALAWLEKTQRPDGSWDAKHQTHGVTALVALALLGAGRTPEECPALVQALAYLVSELDVDTGSLPRWTHDWIYAHTIATLAVTETLALRPGSALRPHAQRMLNVLLAARNPDSGWRYDQPPMGDSDTSITAWAVAALHAAREARLEGDLDAALEGAMKWIVAVTDPDTGVIGYSAKGEASARTPANEDYPRELGEAMTAAGLFARLLIRHARADDPLVEKHVRLLLAKPPRWDPKSLGIDEYYWYYGAHALALVGGRPAKAWDDALFSVARAQNGNPEHRGSWDPIGVWSYCGGRPMTTALIALALEAPFRYALPEETEGKKNKKGR